MIHAWVFRYSVVLILLPSIALVFASSTIASLMPSLNWLSWPDVWQSILWSWRLTQLGSLELVDENGIYFVYFGRIIRFNHGILYGSQICVVRKWKTPYNTKWHIEDGKSVNFVCVWRKSLLVLVCAEHHNYNTHIHNSLFAMTLTIPLSLCLSCAHLSVPWMAHLKGAPHTYTKQASPADTIALNENWLQFSWIIQMQVCVCAHHTTAFRHANEIVNDAHILFPNIQQTQNRTLIELNTIPTYIIRRLDHFKKM